MIISVFARTPAILSTAIMGDSMIRGNWILFAAIFGITAVISLLGFRFKNHVINRLKK
ncbi:MAG: hypothetical protein LBT16_12445 [Treponema sp.]|nr:hypothetical protein [Treponema sp.]